MPDKVDAPKVVRCKLCDQPMLPPNTAKNIGEYDHASGCPDEGRDSQGNFITLLCQRCKSDYDIFDSDAEYRSTYCSAQCQIGDWKAYRRSLRP